MFATCLVCFEDDFGTLHMMDSCYTFCKRTLPDTETDTDTNKLPTPIHTQLRTHNYAHTLSHLKSSLCSDEEWGQVFHQLIGLLCVGTHIVIYNRIVLLHAK